VPGYYDKTEKKYVELPADLTFILLDRLGSIRGWHEKSQSIIYSNEVRDTRQEPFVVKSFKGGLLAEGIYAGIKDRVNAHGGDFTLNCYLAYKNAEGQLVLGSIQFKGAALRAWMDFEKASGADLYKKAVRIKGSKDGKKGAVEFKTPCFFLVDCAEDTNKQAVAIDVELQAYLKGYFSRPKVEAASHTHEEAASSKPPTDEEAAQGAPAEEEEQIPF
jgi:hypothetical protein